MNFKDSYMCDVLFEVKRLRIENEIFIYEDKENFLFVKCLWVENVKIEFEWLLEKFEFCYEKFEVNI